MNPKCGSGVLLKVNTHFFVITAGHVIHDYDPSTIGILIGNEFYSFSGTVHFADPIKFNQNSKTDIAYFHLTGDFANILSAQYTFLDISLVDISHKPEARSSYLVVGFPISRSKFNRQSSSLKIGPFTFLTSQANPEVYKTLTFHPGCNILVKYSKTGIRQIESSNLVIGPDPYGISGGGLWHLPAILTKRDTSIPINLVGIMTEWRESHKALVLSITLF
jgi:hypothetical protein